MGHRILSDIPSCPQKNIPSHECSCLYLSYSPIAHSITGYNAMPSFCFPRGTSLSSLRIHLASCSEHFPSALSVSFLFLKLIHYIQCILFFAFYALCLFFFFLFFALLYLCRSPRWTSGSPRMIAVLVREFESRRGEILNLFAKIKNDQLLRAPSVGKHNSTRVDEGRKS